MADKAKRQPDEWRQRQSAFYHSSAWKRLEADVIKERGGLCEVCLAKGRARPARIVHHKKYVTAETVTDPSVTLNKDNLILVCRDCHAEIHRRDEARKTQRWQVDEFGRITTPPIRGKG